MKQTLERIVKICVYLTFFVPLAVVPSSFIFPFIVPKILLLRSIITVAAAAYALLLLINWQEYKPKLTPISVALLLFLLSFALSTFFGVDPYHSFWDNHERMLGLFTIIHYVAYFFICTCIFKNWTDWKWALRFFLLGGFIVMVIGLLQVGKPELLLNQGSARVASTLGNAIYVGGYGLFLFFVSLVLFLKEKLPIWKYVDAIAAVVSLCGMYYSGTRGSMIGLVVGLGALTMVYAILLKDKPKIRSVLVAVMAAGVFAIGFLIINKQSEFVQNIPMLGRLLNISFKSGTGTTRLIAWNIAVESWKAHPIFGWGPNNFFYAFNQYYNPHSFLFGYGETWFDNAHNILLNTLTVQGLLGILSYLGIFATAIIVLYKRRKELAKNKPLLVVGAAFLMAHLAQNITVFENPTSYLYFMFWLAFINYFVSGAPAEEELKIKVAENSQKNYTQIKPDLNKAVGLGAALFTGALALIIIFVFNIQPARANIKTLKALMLINQDYVLGLAAMREALQFSSPHIDDIRSDIARTAINVLNSNYQTLGAERSVEILNLVYPELQKNVDLHPYDIRNYLSLAQLGQLGAMITRQMRYLTEAETYMEESFKYSPRRQQLVFTLAGLKLQLGKGPDAIAIEEQAIKDEPLASESYWRLAFTYQYLGQLEKAKKTLDRARDMGLTFNDQGKQVEASILQDWAKQPSTKK